MKKFNVMWLYIGICLVGGMLTFIFAIPNNLFMTALTRSLQSMLWFFLLTFAVHMVFKIILRQTLSEEPVDHNEQESMVGKTIDFTTPVEEDDSTSEFEPMKPEKLVKEKIDSKEIAAAVRAMSEQ